MDVDDTILDNQDIEYYLSVLGGGYSQATYNDQISNFGDTYFQLPNPMHGSWTGNTEPPCPYNS